MRAAMWWIDRWRQSDAFARMTAEEQGLYRNLCDEVVLRADGIIPDDARILAKASGDHEAWARSGKSVLKSMKRVQGGWTNETAMEVRAESERRSKKQFDYRSKRASRGNDVGNASGNDAGNEPDNKPLPPEQEKDKYQEREKEKEPNVDPGRFVKAGSTATPNGTPESNPPDFKPTATAGNLTLPPGLSRLGTATAPATEPSNRLTPQSLGIRTDPANFAQVQLAHDLTALVTATHDPAKETKAEALDLLHALSATVSGKRIETLDLRRVSTEWATVTSHAAYKFADDAGFDLALVDGTIRPQKDPVTDQSDGETNTGQSTIPPQTSTLGVSGDAGRVSIGRALGPVPVASGGDSVRLGAA